MLLIVFFNQLFTMVKHFVDAGLYAENTVRNYLNELGKK